MALRSISIGSKGLVAGGTPNAHREWIIANWHMQVRPWPHGSAMVLRPTYPRDKEFTAAQNSGPCSLQIFEYIRHTSVSFHCLDLRGDLMILHRACQRGATAHLLVCLLEWLAPRFLQRTRHSLSPGRSQREPESSSPPRDRQDFQQNRNQRLVQEIPTTQTRAR
jgi:hypothetical protein